MLFSHTFPIFPLSTQLTIVLCRGVHFPLCTLHFTHLLSLSAAKQKRRRLKVQALKVKGIFCTSFFLSALYTHNTLPYLLIDCPFFVSVLNHFSSSCRGLTFFYVRRTSSLFVYLFVCLFVVKHLKWTFLSSPLCVRTFDVNQNQVMMKRSWKRVIICSSQTTN